MPGIGKRVKRSPLIIYNNETKQQQQQQPYGLVTVPNAPEETSVTAVCMFDIFRTSFGNVRQRYQCVYNNMLKQVNLFFLPYRSVVACGF